MVCGVWCVRVVDVGTCVLNASRSKVVWTPRVPDSRRTGPFDLAIVFFGQ